MKNYFLVRILLVLSLVLVLGLAQASSGLAQANTVILKLSHGLPVEHPMHKGAELFKEIVEEKTNGQVQVELFPALQLGSVREQFEGIMLGSIDIAIITTDTPSYLGLPIWRILEAGYIYQSEEHAQKFFNSDLFKGLADRLEKEYGVTVIDPAWYYGTRNLTTKNTPVKKPEDLKGLKIRVPEAPGYINTLKGMGASVTPVAFAELYMALKTNVVDGQENPFATIYTYKYYEAQKYLILTQHLISHNTVFMNTQKLNSFDEKTKKIILNAIKEAGDLNDKLIIGTEGEYLQKLQDEGMVVVEPERELFRTKAIDFMKNEWYTNQEAEFYDKIQKFNQK